VSVTHQSTVDHVIEEMTNRIVERYRPLKIILFGSRARGDHHHGSDVDLLIVVPRVENNHAMTAGILDLLGDMPVSTDVVVTTPEQIAERGSLVGTVLRPALREGQVLYER
jgi:predicted nucleotidyltransferase